MSINSYFSVYPLYQLVDLVPLTCRLPQFSKSRSFSPHIYFKEVIASVAPPRGSCSPLSLRGWKDEWLRESRSGNIDFPSGTQLLDFPPHSCRGIKTQLKVLCTKTKGHRCCAVSSWYFSISIQSNRCAHHLTLCGHEATVFCYPFAFALL